MKDGTYLYVVMLGDQDNIRLTLGLIKPRLGFATFISFDVSLMRDARIHEDYLVHEGVLAGHTSLVQRDMAAVAMACRR